MSKDKEKIRQLLIQPEDGIAPVLNAINGATSTLEIKQFTVTDERLIKALIAAHKRGVKVRIMMNAARPDETRDNDTTLKILKKAGIKAQWSCPKFTITHEKSMVVDKKTAFVATFNWAPKYFGETRDYGVITTDPLQVAQIMACFEADWARVDFKVTDDVGLIWSNTNSRDCFAKFIDACEDSLYVQHPKFVDVPILERILRAQKRGVHVRIICSGKHGVRAWDRAETFASLKIIQEAGIKVHVLKHPKLHAKLMLRDDKHALIGSMNIHRRAFDERRELGIILSDEPLVKRLRDVFEKDWDDTHKFEIPDPLAREASDDSEHDSSVFTT
jgi:phosphatidylserine/phosphatidylglycerophosphate/cardiolipin synthase-like enzyme